MPEQTESERLADLKFMLGDEAGSLAVVLENLTDVMTSVAQHKVYCRVEKGPRAGEGSLDVEAILRTLERTKRLVQETLSRVRRDRPQEASGT
jgi:hypothetical protein